MALAGFRGEPGFLIFTDGGGRETAYNVSDLLRAADIPTGLTHEQVGAITTLANLVVVLIRTLIDRQVLNESFLEDNEYDLADIIESIEEMGGDFVNPDISVS